MFTRLVPKEAGRVVFSWKKTAWLYVMLVPGLVVGLPALTPQLVLAAIVLAFATLCVGHSVGLHRNVIHGAYRAPRWLVRLMVYLFVHTGLGGPLSWVRLHHYRDHWQSQRRCPPYFAYRHGLVRDYFWNLHLEFRPRDVERYRLPCDVENDPWLQFLERTWAWHVVFGWLVAFALLGLGPAAALVSLRVAASILGHWFVGYVAHKYGERRYTIAGAEEEGRNVWLLGVISFGEGFHNNHHAHPSSAKMGERWWEFDLGWGVVRLLEWLGLVDQVKTSGRGGTLKPGARASAPA